MKRTVRSLFESALCARPVSAQAPATDRKELQPRVFVVDDDQSVRNGLSDLLATKNYQFEIFASAAEYLAREPHCGPGCIVLEAQLPEFDGLALQRQLTEEGRAEQIVFISRHGDLRMGIGAMKRGAVDFLPKPFRGEELLSAVAQALARSAEVAEGRARLAKLTPREFEVFRLVIAGLLNKEIGAELGVTLRTIKQHRARVMQKLGVVSVAELVRLALRAGVAPGHRRDSDKVGVDTRSPTDDSPYSQRIFRAHRNSKPETQNAKLKTQNASPTITGGTAISR
jgi:FixJ family two-component response regulator